MSTLVLMSPPTLVIVFINGKDDAIDHHRARLKIDNCWINNWMNEGIAASGADTLRVSIRSFRTVLMALRLVGVLLIYT